MDPGLGLVHADMRGRSSFALDLLEPTRPKVDTYVLDLLERRAFRKAEFVETEDGHCRLRPPLTHELAESLPLWAKELAPIAERIVHTFGDALAGKYLPSTLSLASLVSGGGRAGAAAGRRRCAGVSARFGGGAPLSRRNFVGAEGLEPPTC